MWDLPGPGIEPVSPALAGRLSTTVPPGKPFFVFNNAFQIFHSFIHSFIHSFNSVQRKDGDLTTTPPGKPLATLALIHGF